MRISKPWLGSTAGVLALSLALACSEDPVDQYAPISAACDACLSHPADGSCTPEWLACTELPVCEAYVLCQLQAGCYEEPGASTCRDDAGCELGEDGDGAPAAASAEFEVCARTECAAACGFRAP